jgi:hypothetical protein
MLSSGNIAAPSRKKSRAIVASSRKSSRARPEGQVDPPDSDESGRSRSASPKTQHPPPTVAARTTATRTTSTSSTSSMPRDAFKDKYSGEPGLALDRWAAKARRLLAFYDQLPDARAVAWLATGLDGAAGDWFDEYVLTHGQPPSTPDALVAAMRSRFQPVNAIETARRELDVLRQEKGRYGQRVHDSLPYSCRTPAEYRCWIEDLPVPPRSAPRDRRSYRAGRATAGHTRGNDRTRRTYRRTNQQSLASRHEGDSRRCLVRR